MNTRHATISRTARVAAGSLLALSAIAASTASTFAAKGGSGAIWTTNETCQTPAAQDDNHYAVGETVYLRGKNFDANVAVSWTITGQPGGASSDPAIVVASGSGSTDGDGYFCIAAYTVLDGDAGEYKAEVSRGDSTKKDNYRVDAPVTSGGDDDTTPPADDTTPPADDTTPPAGDTTPPGDDTTPPADDTTPPAGDTTPPADDIKPPSQEVEGATDVVTPPVKIELPPTDTIDGSNGSAPTILILGLGALAGLAVLLAPTRRRTAVEQA